LSMEIGDLTALVGVNIAIMGVIMAPVMYIVNHMHKQAMNKIDEVKTAICKQLHSEVNRSKDVHEKINSRLEGLEKTPI